MSHSPITSHVLDTSNGKPAEGIKVTLHLAQESVKAGSPIISWDLLASAVTDKDGRCSTLLSADHKLVSGIYKAIFQFGDYFKSTKNKDCFYPYAEIVFEVVDPSQHYHIPLLLSNYGYTTYRGS